MEDSNPAPTARVFISLIFMVLFPLYEAGCYALLYIKRKNLSIKKRLPSLHVASLAGWIAYFNLIVSVYGRVPCGIFYIATLLVAPISVGPQLIRALSLRGTLEYSRLMIQDELSTREEHLNSKGNQVQSEKSNDSASTKNGADLVIERTRKIVTVTKWALFVVPTILLICTLALASDANQLQSNDFGQCQPEPLHFQYASPAFGVMSALLAFIATVLVRKLDDELGLRKEITRNVIFLGFSYIGIMIVRFSGHFDWQPLLQTIQQMILSFSMAIAPCFPELNTDALTLWASNQRKRINPATRSAVPGYGRPIPKESRNTRASLIGRRGSAVALKQETRSRETIMSWDAGLCILLSTQEGINAFSQHCAREFSAENVRFWCAVNGYRAKFDEENVIESTDTEEDKSVITQTSDKNDIKNTAKEIYNAFISPNSQNQVNLSSKQKSEIKASLDSGNFAKDTFDVAQREIFSVMSRDSYPRFLASRKQRMTLI